MTEYILETALPMIPTDAIEDLEAPITTSDYLLTIKNLKNGKSPGPNGYTPRFYKPFTQQLASIMARAFEEVEDAHPLSTQILQAQIMVMPKPGKDHTNCSNYRPISPLNVDLKLFSKIIANHLGPILPSLIHSDQVGFIPGREARDNTTKTLLLITYAQRKHIPVCLLACDAEKAFDRVSWPFLKSSLQSPRLLPKMMSLYSNSRKSWLMVNTQRHLRSIMGPDKAAHCPPSSLLSPLNIWPKQSVTTIPYMASTPPQPIVSSPYTLMTYCFT